MTPTSPRASCHPTKKRYLDGLCRTCWQVAQQEVRIARRIAEPPRLRALVVTQVRWAAAPLPKCPHCGHAGPWWNGQHCSLCGANAYVRPADLEALGARVMAVP